MINYFSAVEGKLALRNLRADELYVISADLDELAEVIKSVGLAESVMNSSSMDFASEYGFETNNAAWDLAYKAMELAGYTIAEEE